MPEISPEALAPYAPYFLIYLACAIVGLFLIPRLWRVLGRGAETALPALPLQLSDGVLLVGAFAAFFFAWRFPWLLAVGLVVPFFIWQRRLGGWMAYWQGGWFSVLPLLLLGTVGLHAALQLGAGSMALVLKAMGLEVPAQPAINLLLNAPEEKIVVLIAYAVVGAPMIEEVLFRGVLYPMFRVSMSRAWAAGVSSLLFAGMHGHVASLLPLLLLALALCWVLERTQSLLACILVHAVFNGLTIGALLLVRHLISSMGGSE